MRPLFRDIPFRDPFEIFTQIMATRPDCPVFLDSVRTDTAQGRYSYIAVNPFERLVLKNDPAAFDTLQRAWRPYRIDTQPGLPPFQTGVAGLFSYDLMFGLETLPDQQPDPLHCPDLAVGFYDRIYAFDHLKKQAFIIASDAGGGEAALKIRAAEDMLHDAASLSSPEESAETIPLDWQPAHTPSAFKRKIQAAIDAIYNGTFSQCNLTERWQAAVPPNITSLDLYRRLRARNPAPFACYLDIGAHQILSSSPERFLKLTGTTLETRPIKGTARRGLTAAEDQHQRDALAASAKDRAENAMIVDLLRNDLSRVCRPHSVRVPDLCVVESYATVHHLVSTVTGTLKDNLDAVDALRAAWAGGSITGAPKIKACEMIARLEPFRRGAFFGAAGFIGFDGAMDTNLLIRTLVRHQDHLYTQVGGGIVADSLPDAEYDEILAKAAPLLQKDMV